jgi:hypothetical protein
MLISSGVPIAQSVGLKDVSRLVINSADGVFVESDVRPTAWWSDGSIQWVQVELLDSIESGKQKNYNLVLSKTASVSTINPLSYIINSSPIGKNAVVDTGSAVFTIGAEGLIRSIKTRDGLTLTGSATSFAFDGKTDTFSDTQVRRMEFEYIGPLVCYLVVETISKSFTTAATVKEFGRISTTRRYRFVKGSSLATVTSVIKWEGSKNGTEAMMSDGKTVNGVLGTSWFDTIKIDPSLLDNPSLFHLDQPLRSNRKQSRVLKTEGASISLPLKDKKNMIIMGLRRMDLYEPQSLSQSQGELRIYHASDKFWLAHHQGASTTCLIGVCGVNQSDANLLADLNHPVRLFADPSYYQVAGKSVPFSSNSLGSQYVAALTQICNKTLSLIARDGLYGLQTYAWWPRYWDDNEIEMSDKEANWDTLYKTGAFTDYYSTSRSAATLSLMTQNSLWLDNLAHPSALRMLWTQIMHTSPEDNWVYGNWASAGYGCGRSDFNSSHSYYENLFWYYLLTGNRLVVDILARGEERMINEVKSQPLAGRFPHQRLRAWRFLSQVHGDPVKRKLFRDAWISSMQRAINECYVEGTYNGEPAAFWTDGVKKAGTIATPNLYALSIWDLESLWEYGKEIPFVSGPTNSQSHPWNILIKVVSTIQRYGSFIVGGDSTLAKSSKWARAFSFTWDDANKIINLKVQPDSENVSTMYPGDLPGMCASWARAAVISGDPAMKQKAQELITYTLSLIKEGGQPMNKLSGLADSTLADAITSLI